MIWFTSDLHLNDDGDFIVGKRGFSTLNDMKDTILHNLSKALNSDNAADKELIILGDICNVDKSFESIEDAVNSLHDVIKDTPTRIVLGNHDLRRYYTTERNLYIVKNIHEFIMYKSLYSKISDNIESITTSEYMRSKDDRYLFYLTHYPVFTDPMPSKGTEIFNLHGHTHQKEPYVFGTFYYMYDVGVDAHNFKPVSYTEIMDYCFSVEHWRYL